MAVILLADDEARIRRLVSDFLKRDGHTVLEAADGRAALTLLEQEPIDLAILDVMMPYADGFAVLAAIRARSGDRMPVMMLTARAEEADQITGFETGADDYVTKPFSPVVLAARVRSLLRRTGAGVREVSTFGALEIDELRRSVTVAGKPCELTPKEYELLIYYIPLHFLIIFLNHLSSLYGQLPLWTIRPSSFIYILPSSVSTRLPRKPSLRSSTFSILCFTVSLYNSESFLYAYKAPVRLNSTRA